MDYTAVLEFFYWATHGYGTGLRSIFLHVALPEIEDDSVQRINNIQKHKTKLQVADEFERIR
jgi:hypothetical protein